MVVQNREGRMHLEGAFIKRILRTGPTLHMRHLLRQNECQREFALLEVHGTLVRHQPLEARPRGPHASARGRKTTSLAVRPFKVGPAEHQHPYNQERAINMSILRLSGLGKLPHVGLCCSWPCRGHLWQTMYNYPKVAGNLLARCPGTLAPAVPASSQAVSVVQRLPNSCTGSRDSCRSQPFLPMLANTWPISGRFRPTVAEIYELLVAHLGGIWASHFRPNSDKPGRISAVQRRQDIGHCLPNAAQADQYLANIGQDLGSRISAPGTNAWQRLDNASATSGNFGQLRCSLGL